MHDQTWTQRKQSTKAGAGKPAINGARKERPPTKLVTL
jgi:hypothetical protein